MASKKGAHKLMSSSITANRSVDIVVRLSIETKVLTCHDAVVCGLQVSMSHDSMSHDSMSHVSSRHLKNMEVPTVKNNTRS